jgi:hypothetical protein
MLLYSLIGFSSYSLKNHHAIFQYNISVHFFLFQKNYLNGRFDDVNERKGYFNVLDPINYFRNGFSKKSTAIS